MREQWYGNDRDVVKWGAVVHLARREAIPAILYVPLSRPALDPPSSLATATGTVAVPPDVVRHFRDLGDLQRLAATTGIEIELVATPFDRREAYFAAIRGRLDARTTPVLLFLDPDIGIEPEPAGPEHVTSAEVAALFAALPAGGQLVCYQRARRQKDWRGRARRAFANAPGLPSFDVEVLESPLTRDMLLMAARRPATQNAGA